jgi:hypothetical protein
LLVTFVKPEKKFVQSHIRANCDLTRLNEAMQAAAK